MFDVYTYRNYKTVIKDRVRWLRAKRPSLTLKKIADRVPMQYTYLSKVLNDSASNLSEDQLYRICQDLQFLPNEIDFLFLLRSHTVAVDTGRQEYLSGKIDQSVKLNRLNVEHQVFQAEKLAQETQYLLNPFAVLLHAALFIEKYRKAPRSLSSLFGISPTRLKQNLEILASTGFIETGEDIWEIKRVVQRRLHFGKEHPLMRAHQSGLKAALQSRLNQTSDEEKESFLVSFTMDKDAYAKTQEAFQRFLKEIQSIAQSSSNTELYQMNFELVKWF